jgi:membrane-bound lytic murein transglycosylase B
MEPAALAAQLVEVERTIRDPEAPAAAAAEAGRLQQLAYSRWVTRPEWDDAVRSGIPDDLRTAVDRNLQARRVVVEAARRRAQPPSPTIPAWTIIDPLPPEQLLQHYRDASAATGVPWEYLAAINLVETRMGRIVGLSSAGARGPMQFLPTTWAECCTGDIDDPKDAILGAAMYLVDRGAPADMAKALYGYNPSDPYVASVTEYAANLRDDERAYFGYHAWQVFVGTSAGTIRLPVGYSATEPVDAVTYAAEHPEDVL